MYLNSKFLLIILVCIPLCKSSVAISNIYKTNFYFSGNHDCICIKQCASLHGTLKICNVLNLVDVYLNQPGLAQRTPTISLISQVQIKDIGGTVELECSVQYATDYPVIWIKSDTSQGQNPLLISSGSTLILRDSRFSLRFDPSSTLYTLQIKDLQETDAGSYQCQILIGVNNRVTANVDVLVRMPPVISDNSTRSLVVSEGQEVKLECYASGFPLPKISWRRENNVILPTGGAIYRGNTLKISSVKYVSITFGCFFYDKVTVILSSNAGKKTVEHTTALLKIQLAEELVEILQLKLNLHRSSQFHVHESARHSNTTWTWNVTCKFLILLSSLNLNNFLMNNYLLQCCLSPTTDFLDQRWDLLVQ